MSLQGMHWPRTVEDATALLAEDPDARPIAGGATLVAMMNARVIEPLALVNLARIDELRGISVLADGRVRIGAYTRHRETAECLALSGTAAVVRQAAGQIANATVRNMGTIGGSISFADPGLDYPPAIVAARAEIEIASTSGRRRVAAHEFFVDWYTTALEPGEIVTAVVLAREPGGAAYDKHARISGDFATAAAAVCIASGSTVRAVIGACGPTPISDPAADALLSSDRSDSAVARAASMLDAKADPLDDVRGSAEYRRLLIPRLLLRALRRAEASAPGSER
jgi:aerobic carbon-monoxide dehydrogenase medium subunit